LLSVHTGDFFNYTREKNGPHCLIWSRPVDSYTLDNLIGKAYVSYCIDTWLGTSSVDCRVVCAGVYLTFSPRDVVFSGWVGDQVRV
jgi:hypothetical protein